MEEVHENKNRKNTVVTIYDCYVANSTHSHQCNHCVCGKYRLNSGTKNEEKKKTVEPTKDDPVESTSESSQESSETAKSSEPTESSSEKKLADFESEESEPKKENELDGSVYGSGAGVPGDRILFEVLEHYRQIYLRFLVSLQKQLLLN